MAKRSKSKINVLLSSVSNKEDLEGVLLIKNKNLSIVLKNATSHYKKIKKLKKDGATRTINAPDDLLKNIQRLILDKILVLERISSCVYGFRKGRGIVENAT